jgi:hypothetical protein
MVGVRLVELFFLLAWAAGFWLFWKQTRRTLLLGVYVGCTLSWTHDWVLGGPEVWKMDFHPHTIWIATWGSRPEALWAPLSYGAFFGIGLFAWLRYCETPLRARLGAWRYLAVFPAAFVGNVIVEGAIIEWAHTNRYHQPGHWLVFNLPWLHLVTTGAMLSAILFFTVEAVRVFEYFGWRDLEPAGAPAPVPAQPVFSPAGAVSPTAQPETPPGVAPATAAVPRRVRTAMFVVGVALPQAGLTFATMVALYLYDWVHVPLR